MNLSFGVTVHEDFITEADELEIVEATKALPWRSPLEWNPRLGSFPHCTAMLALGLEGVPRCLAALGERLSAQTLLALDYAAGGGLPMHADAATVGDVAIVSLLGGATTVFRNGDAVHEVPCARRSLLWMRDGINRRPWRHEVLPVVSRRISLVFSGAPLRTIVARPPDPRRGYPITT